MGESIHPLVEHAAVINDALADLAGLGPVALQGLVADPAIFGGLGEREAAFGDV